MGLFDIFKKKANTDMCEPNPGDDLKAYIHKLGFEVTETVNERFYIRKDSIPSASEIIEVLKVIPFDKEVFFWNYYHETISDPGSYVTAVVVGDHAVYMEGNHGWSSDYKRISFEELAELIIKNWDKDWEMDGYFINSIRIEKHWGCERHGYLKNAIVMR